MVFGRDVTKTMVSVINDICSANFIKISSECKTYQSSDQTVQITCGGTAWESGASSPENSSLCASCYESISSRQAGLHDLYKTRWAAGNGVNIPESFDSELNRIMNEMDNCIISCKSCVFDNLSQTANFSYNSSCKLTSDSVTEFTNGVTADLVNEISKSSGFAQALTTAIGAGDAVNLVSNLKNRIEAVVDVDILNSIISEMSQKQSIVLSGDSNLTSGMTQTASFTGVSNLFSNTDIATSILSEQELELAQRVIDEKSIIGPAGEFLKDSSITLANFISSLSGQILRYGLWVVTGMLFFMTFYALYRTYNVRKYTETSVETTRSYEN